MSLNNIAKAFEIVDKTYENVEKLMKFCDSIAEDNGFISVSDRFLRYKSDKDYEGWMTRIFVKLYQRRDSNILENEWLDGPVYAFYISFYDEAAIYISRYDYNDIGEWSKGVFPSSYWVFTWPLEEDKDEFERTIISESEKILLSKPISIEISEKYWGLSKVTFTRHELMDINKDNVVDKVFRQFDKL